MGGEVCLQTSAKGIFAQPMHEHVEEAPTLGVDNCPVKECANFIWMMNSCLDGLHAINRITAKGQRALVVTKIRPHIPLGMDGIDCQIFHHVGKALVEPEVIPPLHRHEIAKPLVAELVANDGGNVLLVGDGRRGWVG